MLSRRVKVTFSDSYHLCKSHTMFKLFKRILLSSLSVLFVSVILWSVLLLNPGLSYAHQTTVENVTIYHDQPLEVGTEEVIREALTIIKKAAIYSHDFEVQLCLNDGSSYPQLHPLKGGAAYAFLDKAIIYGSEPNFKENVATSQWEINNYELRKYDLTYLIAHEMMHCVQNEENVWLQFNAGNWKLEGHSEYISREWKEDGLLKEKVQFFQEEEKIEHAGLPVIDLEDGTKQFYPYYKYGIVTQYLYEVEGLNFEEFIDDERSLDDLYVELKEWGVE